MRAWLVVAIAALVLIVGATLVGTFTFAGAFREHRSRLPSVADMFKVQPGSFRKRGCEILRGSCFARNPTSLSNRGRFKVLAMGSRAWTPEVKV